jgi:hypothetical protein
MSLDLSVAQAMQQQLNELEKRVSELEERLAYHLDDHNLSEEAE